MASGMFSFLFSFLIVLLNAPTIAQLFLNKEIVFQKSIIVAWLTITLSLAILYFAKGKLLPSIFGILMPQKHSLGHPYLRSL